MRKITRREHLAKLGICAAGHACSSYTLPDAQHELSRPFKIALGEYSFNAVFRAGKYSPLDLAALTKNQLGLEAIDYVSSFWADKARDQTFLRELKKRAEDNGVLNHVIPVDLHQGELGDLDESKRKLAVEAHRPWVDVAKFLRCPSIRVNLHGFQVQDIGAPGHKEAVFKASVDGYGRVLEYGAQNNINVAVQNHLGYSCDPDWLVGVMKQANSKYAGVQADPDHFEELFVSTKPGGGYEVKKGAIFDKYQSLAKIMPYAKAVNAKTHAFDAHGNETTLEYHRILKIVNNSGYREYIGIGWEPEGQGRSMSAGQGIKATKALLEKEMAQLS